MNVHVAAGGLGQMSLVNDYQTFRPSLHRFFISGSEMQGMMTYGHLTYPSLPPVYVAMPYISLPLMKTLNWVKTSGNH